MQLNSATVGFTMQPSLADTNHQEQEAPMRFISLIAPALLAETRYVEIVPEQIAGSVEVTEEEILDDLLYPADHRAVSDGSGVDPNRN
jgi:hypothetical protein